MRLLIFSQYFWPESFIINDLARTLRDQGHHITVATGKPNYPEGKIFPDYKAKGLQRELFDGDIEVFRVPLRPRGKSGARGLLLNYLSFVFSGLIYFPYLLRGRHFDAILIFAGSPNVALPALPLKWLKRAHLALWVQDLWPQSLQATGYINNPLILRIVGWVVRFTYFCADTVLVQSEAFKAPVAHYTTPKKISYYPNSLCISDSSAEEKTPLPASLIKTLKENFCVTFAGNIGSAQSVHTIVEAAAMLQGQSEIKFVMVGSGSMSDWVHEKIKELSLDNVVMAGRFPPSSMPELFSCSSCLLVTLKADEIFSYTVPSKVQSYLAAGKPIIASLNGEGARIVLEAGAGLACPAEDAKALADCIRKLASLSESECQRMGEHGKSYFMKNYEMNNQAHRLIEILQKRMASV